MTIQNIIFYLKKQNVEYMFFGDPNVIINTFSPLKEIKDNSITWIRNLSLDTVKIINGHENILVFSPISENTKYLKTNYIITNNPHRVFFIVLERFFYEKKDANISESAVIESNKIGKNVSIGALSYIGPEVIIGDNCKIGNHVSIESRVNIGNNVVIDSGARIGIDGFGHYLNDDGTSTRIPHLGGVTIGNNVCIGANTIIARGTLSDTIIKDDVKIDSLCGICHNSEIHERVIITGGAGVAGSAVIKKDSWLAPGCIVNSGTTVGEGCMIGINSVVSHDIPDGKYAFGIPAKVIKDNNDTKYKI